MVLVVVGLRAKVSMALRWLGDVRLIAVAVNVDDEGGVHQMHGNDGGGVCVESMKSVAPWTTHSGSVLTSWVTFFFRKVDKEGKGVVSVERLSRAIDRLQLTLCKSKAGACVR